MANRADVVTTYVPQAKLDWIWRLLDSGHARRTIASLVGVSTDTVDRIRNNNLRKTQPRYKADVSGRRMRCQICGGLLPCLRPSCLATARNRRIGSDLPNRDVEFLLSLSADTVAVACAIRERGFIDENGNFHPPWNAYDYAARAGLQPIDLALQPIKVQI